MKKKVIIFICLCIIVIIAAVIIYLNKIMPLEAMLDETTNDFFDIKKIVSIKMYVGRYGKEYNIDSMDQIADLFERIKKINVRKKHTDTDNKIDKNGLIHMSIRYSNQKSKTIIFYGSNTIEFSDYRNGDFTFVYYKIIDGYNSINEFIENLDTTLKTLK